MRLACLASGSSGNSIYIGDGDTHLLIDAGISCKRICQGLAGIGVAPQDLSAVLITHEHSDHVSGLPVFAKKTGAPLCSAPETLGWLREHGLRELAPERFRAVREDEPFAVGDLTVTPIRISHDAVHPLAYRIDGPSSSAAVMTDLGYYDPYIVQHLQQLDAILIESNHDIHMLQAGPYPYPLKRRIMGEKGHLSNESAGQLLSEICCDRLKYIVLGHISQENNLPELAYEAVRLEIDLSENAYRAADYAISVARRDVPSPVIEF